MYRDLRKLENIELLILGWDGVAVAMHPHPFSIDGTIEEPRIFCSTFTVPAREVAAKHEYGFWALRQMAADLSRHGLDFADFGVA